MTAVSAVYWPRVATLGRVTWLAASGGSGWYTIRIAGVSHNRSSGVINIPTHFGGDRDDETFTVRDADGDTDKITFTITVAADPRRTRVREVKRALAAAARRAMSSALDTIGGLFGAIGKSSLTLAGRQVALGDSPAAPAADPEAIHGLSAEVRIADLTRPLVEVDVDLVDGAAGTDRIEGCFHGPRPPGGLGRVRHRGLRRGVRRQAPVTVASGRRVPAARPGAPADPQDGGCLSPVFRQWEVSGGSEINLSH